MSTSRRTLTFAAMALGAASSAVAAAPSVVGPPAPRSGPAAVAQAQGTLGAAAPALPAYLRDRGAGRPDVDVRHLHPARRAGSSIPSSSTTATTMSSTSPRSSATRATSTTSGAIARSEGLLFLSYGLGQNLAIEVEAAYISASFEKAADDPSQGRRASRSRALATSRARSAGAGARRTRAGRSSSATSRR